MAASHAVYFVAEPMVEIPRPSQGARHQQQAQAFITARQEADAQALQGQGAGTANSAGRGQHPPEPRQYPALYQAPPHQETQYQAPPYQAATYELPRQDQTPQY